MPTCVLAVVVTAPTAIQAQTIVTAVVPTSTLQPPAARFGKLGALISPGGGTRLADVKGTAAPPALGQADSLASRDAHAEAGAIIGGLTGAIAGGLAFAHWTHRAGAVNNGTGTLGGAVVGAGLVGGLAALAGLLIGSAIRR